jgi:acetylornithine deacetylase
MSNNFINKEIENNRQRYISLIRELVKISEKGEAALQELIGSKISEIGCNVESFKLLPIQLSPEKEFASEENIELSERISLVGWYPGLGGGQSLMFFAHPDSEEIKGLENWKHEPFGAEVEDGRIYGWGIADDLLGVATMIGALDALVIAGIEFKGDLYLCSSASKRNARGVTAILNKGYKADAAIYLHPAESGEGLKEIKAFASGILNFRITIMGKSPETTEPGHTVFAHQGVNPLDKAINLIHALKELDSRRGANTYNNALNEAIGRSTNLLISYVNYGDPRFLSRMSDKCVIGASMSFPPEEKMSELMEVIIDTIQIVSQSDSWMKVNPPKIEWIFGTQAVETPIDHPLYLIASKAIEEVTGIKPHVNPLHTASDIRNPILFSGIPTIGFGSFAGDLVQSGGHDEWIDIESYLDSIKICARIIMKWCN